MDQIIRALFVTCGALAMVLCVTKLKTLSELTRYVIENRRPVIRQFLKLHKCLLLLFLVGYLRVVFSFFTYSETSSDLFIAALLFFGGALVLHGTIGQIKIVTEIKETLLKFLPICSYCKKVRVSDSKADGAEEKWMEVDTFFTQEDMASFTHGLCSECLKKEEEKYNL